MDVTAHVPAELLNNDQNLQTGAEIPAADEDSASNLQFVINDDNDRRRAYNASSYPKDLDLPNEFSASEDDLVAIRFEFPSDIASGTLEISANVDSANPEARAYIVTPLNPLPPTKKLVTLNPATSIDLNSASDTDLLWELAEQGEQTLYIEGLAAKDDLEVKLSFKVNGTEVASESVHMQVLPSTERTLKVLAYSGMGYRAMAHMNDSDNSLRRDDDGYENDADRVTPIAFRQNGVVSSQNVHISWRFVDVTILNQTNAIFNELILQGRNLYICEELDNAAGLARGGDEIMILGKPRQKAAPPPTPPKWTLAHEWLHAFSDLRHVNVTNNIMWGTSPPPEEVDSNNNGVLDANETMAEEGPEGYVNQDQYNHFIN